MVDVKPDIRTIAKYQQRRRFEKPRLNKQEFNALKKHYDEKLAICEACKLRVKEEQYLYKYNDKFYHDVCSQGIEGRIKVR